MGKAQSPAENIAIFGVTGALGREIQAALEVDQDEIGRFIPVAGPSSAGASVTWRGTSQPVVTAGSVDPGLIDLAALACPAPAARREAVRLVKAGVRVVDASGGLFHPPLPVGLATAATLVWPRLARHEETDAELVALPGDVASTLAPVLEALSTATAAGLLPRLRSIDAVVLRSATAAGRRGVQALSSQTVALLNYQPVLDPGPFPAALAFSVVSPALEDAVLDEGRAGDELRALLPALEGVPLNLVPVLVPAFSGLSAVLTVRFVEAPSLERVRGVLLAHPDLAPAETAALDDEDAEDDDVDAAAAPTSRRETSTSDGGPASLRDTVDHDAVRVQAPHLGADGALRLVVMADPLHRTAAACEAILARWLAEAAD
jgi:aspartate-semialdehyde dehydrogenase